VTTSAVQDAEYILEAVKINGNQDLIYIAEKHVTEVKKISETATAQKTTQIEIRTETAEIISDNIATEIQLVKTESKLTQVKKTRNELALSIFLAILAVIVFLVIKFYNKIKKLLPFLP
jgi:high-affinity K+ transport system ATPase subunit B